MTESTKHNLSFFIRILVSALFIVSAIAKLYPSPYFAISTFEVKQLYPLGFSEQLAPFFSRILIGIELGLGLLLLQRRLLRLLVLPATILLLLVFIIHLSIETFGSGGNAGNCGCFGELIPMTPIEAIIKNVVAVILLAVVYKITPVRNERQDNFWYLCSIVLASILALFMLAPIQPIAAENQENQAVDTLTVDNPVLPSETVPVNADTIKAAAKVKDTVAVAEKPKAPAAKKSGYASYFRDIDNGKKLFCLFVPGCEHCKDAARDLTNLKKKNKDFPDIRIVFMNEEADLIPAFFEYAGAEYPYKVIEIIPFWKLLGQGRDTPGVKYLWNGNEYIFFDGINDNQFSAKALEKVISETDKKYK